jgi:hypothetical protein
LLFLQGFFAREISVDFYLTLMYNNCIRVDYERF